MKHSKIIPSMFVHFLKSKQDTHSGKKLLRITSLLSLLAVFSLVISCKSSIEPDENIIINPLNAIEREVRLSEFTDNIIYIALDNQVMFQHPNRIEFAENHIIMATYPGSILSFDRRGNLLAEIGSRGRGPGEYQYGMHFTLDSENELVYIYDGHKIITYSFGGLFIREFSISQFEGNFWDINYEDGKIFLAGTLQYGISKYDWLILDTLGNQYSYKTSSIENFKTGYPGVSGFFNTKGRLHYWNNFNDTVFIIQDSLYLSAMSFSPGEFKLPKTDISGENFRLYFGLQNIIGAGEYLFLSFYLDNHLQSGFIKKGEDILTTIGRIDSYSGFDTPGIYNDIDSGLTFTPFYTYFENKDEYLIGWFHAYKLVNHVESEAFKNSTPKNPEKKKELEELAARLDENDNPVLMLVKLEE
ncbi:MAG: 6-bladed beta-propeller [Bacteroidales bacterium]